ncbi:MAG: hypothetical protein A3E07_01145 [Candidatus Wildermuthbacteria bacterium RIFCSPHIGHO2_12_FULL_45_9]|uniref:DUF3800 domain-containing protein n=1 Tax=Candidatus Wildermuthbacteria bacterium RIFCSPHIGHO2_02_FULL_45_25 TaxID=1802450 RepID=A0A1G2R0B7_9BACT|nr:MAG: hypothetical protein A2748_02090 [Candidatus Wildermuthbacteria bacterium RIFCSPHIGHO2_01_FULL_45_20]OHA65712.1 MAG: hypothetical protein A3C04_02235 [Candidatus Wildermuthbacteria bacterium RIFCSPHIGHO2_02_FULL_45_25]OHA70267.1 MAG: hypothetical protein A3E07_01145 [Candidatus Wildermuthbacteria bacterium RIFCSPHIGHO2_12_FULL_45_9]
MLVFIDESGDTGRKLDCGSSRYFVVSMVFFEENDEAIACDQRISLLKKELRMPDGYEFKFRKMRREQREAFLKAVLPYSFGYFSVVINKDPKKLYGDGFIVKESFYKYACFLVFENAKPHLRNATVVIDGSGSREFKHELQVYLRKKTDGLIKKVKIQSSHSNNLIQLVDMIAGSVHRSFTGKGDKDIYRRIIKPHEFKVQVWP